MVRAEIEVDRALWTVTERRLKGGAERGLPLGMHWKRWVRWPGPAQHGRARTNMCIPVHRLHAARERGRCQAANLAEGRHGQSTPVVPASRILSGKPANKQSAVFKPLEERTCIFPPNNHSNWNSCGFDPRPFAGLNGMAGNTGWSTIT